MPVHIVPEVLRVIRGPRHGTASDGCCLGKPAQWQSHDGCSFPHSNFLGDSTHLLHPDVALLLTARGRFKQPCLCHRVRQDEFVLLRCAAPCHDLDSAPKPHVCAKHVCGRFVRVIHHNEPSFFVPHRAGSLRD